MRPFTVILAAGLAAVLALLVASYLAVERMRKDIFPDVGAPTIYVSQPYGGMDPSMHAMPGVTAIGYTNSMAGAKETTLYDVDTKAGTLVRQVPPNDGVLGTVGQLGVTVEGPVAFDVWSDSRGAHMGWLVAGGRLHTVNLNSGKAQAVGAITGLTGAVTDIAILPAM